MKEKLAAGLAARTGDSDVELDPSDVHQASDDDV